VAAVAVAAVAAAAKDTNAKFHAYVKTAMPA